MTNPSPCTQDCARRCAGCAVTCPEWAVYTARRDADYAKRAAKCRDAGYTVAGQNNVRQQDRLKRNGRRHWK